MPIPETPYTRKEAYLNAIATGDSSGIPETPYTREKMYLDYIARNGGGGGGGGGGGSSTLSGLTDVDISNPTDGQTLVYDAASSKWVNGSGGGGGGGFTLLPGTYDGNANTITLNKTCEELYVLMQDSVVAIQFEPAAGMTVIEFIAQATNEYSFSILSGFGAWGSGSDVVVFQARQPYSPS